MSLEKLYARDNAFSINFMHKMNKYSINLDK